jgi:single-strand DNA-binding protein
MNKVILFGRLTKDLEVKGYGEGKKVGNFNLAVNRNMDREKVDFIQCTVWNKTCEIMEKYTNKGSQILIEGEINIDKVNDQFYTKVNVSKVTLISSGEKQNTKKEEYVAPQNVEPNFDEFEETNVFKVNKEDLPF